MEKLEFHLIWNPQEKVYVEEDEARYPIRWNPDTGWMAPTCHWWSVEEAESELGFIVSVQGGPLDIDEATPALMEKLRKVQDQEAKVIDGHDAFGPVRVPVTVISADGVSSGVLTSDDRGDLIEIAKGRFCIQVEFSVDAVSYDEARTVVENALIGVAIMGEGWDPDIHIHELVR